MIRTLSGVLVLIGVIVVSIVEAQADPYRGPFEGRVVDADTGKPIEGAVVFVEWYILHVLVIPTFFDAVEVQTDTNGRFFIPKNWSWLPWRNLVMESESVVLKAGYAPVETNWQPILQAKAVLERLPPAEREKPEAGCDLAGSGDSASLILQCPESVYRWYPIHIENGEAVFRLQKSTTRLTSLGNFNTMFIPDDRHRLLSEEFHRHNTLFAGDEEKRPAIGQEGGVVESSPSRDRRLPESETGHP